MSVIAEYALCSDGLVLSEALSSVPVRLEVERGVSVDGDHHRLFVWAEGSDLDAFEAAMAADPTAANVRALSEGGGRRLYRLDLTDAVEVVLYPLWAELGAVRLEATYADGWWHAKMQFPDRTAFSDYRAALNEHGVEFRLERLYDADRRAGDDRLTDEQRETLMLAYERGFFEVPRDVTMSELAAELGVSDQAVSERLRRGYARLVADALDVD